MDSGDRKIKIREVWAHNLESEFQLITEFIDHFPFVAMDTEFPGVVFFPTIPTNGNLKINHADFLYSTLKQNVDHLPLIQVGITLSDESGDLPTDESSGESFIWQFNFRDFDPNRHAYAPDSISLLKRSGIDFEKLGRDGADSFRFAQLLMSSGLVCNDAVSWITFHSAYDFGYLVKILTSRRLPSRRLEFLKVMNMFFRNVYDVKYLMKFTHNLYGGLDRLAQTLEIKRVGISHQAGSDSLVTWWVFQRMKEGFFGGVMNRKHAGVLYGLEGLCY